jgi:hypothetical protein
MCTNNAHGHICSCKNNPIKPIGLADVHPDRLQWKIIQIDAPSAEYDIAGNIFSNFKSAHKFACDLQTIRSFLVIPDNFMGFTIGGKVFLKSINEMHILREKIASFYELHPFWKKLTNDLYSLISMHHSMSRAYPLEWTREETYLEAENGTHCISCNADLHLKSYTNEEDVYVSILAKNYIVFCAKCVSARLMFDDSVFAKNE